MSVFNVDKIKVPQETVFNATKIKIQLQTKSTKRYFNNEGFLSLQLN